jgi:hypothetical protein
MTISANLEKFLEKKVIDWEKDKPLKISTKIAYRFRLEDYDGSEKDWLRQFDVFLEDPKVSQISELILGVWPSPYETSSAFIIDKLVSVADRLMNLKAIFLGDITFEESEMSWITQSNVSPLLDAYPKLEHLTVRGGNQLQFTPVKHYNLKELVVQTGGLDKNVIDGICNSELLELELLELWLGDENYGANYGLEDLQPIIQGNLFPKLKNLGLCNGYKQDEIAKAIVSSPLLSKLEVLNLSMGALTNKGATILLNSKEVKKLKKLDLHHHYCSDDMMEKLKKLGIEVNLDEQEEVDDYDPEEGEEPDYYISVGE